MSLRLKGCCAVFALWSVASCTFEEVDHYSAESELSNQRHIIYLHGRIVEDQGLPAISPRFGEYQFHEIVLRLERANFAVHAEIRGADADPLMHATQVASTISRLIDTGVEGSHITIIGASKGAYIASLASHIADRNDLNFVLLAGCSTGVVDSMIEQEIELHGRVLTIRDVLDTQLAGSCQAVVDRSPEVTDFQQLVVNTGLEHGLIFRPEEAWLTPSIRWALTPVSSHP